MGTITKAFQRRKAELEGPAESVPEPPPETHPPPPAPPESLEATPGDGAGSSAPTLPEVQAEPASDEAKRPEPETALAASPEGAQAPSGQAAAEEGDTAAPAEEESAGPASGPARHEPPPEPAAAAGPVDPSLVSLSDPDGFEADLFRLLRTRILFPRAGRPPRTILVTSALPEEGKSFIAANLAINMARHVDQHVLLVDCDLRKPSIHTKFGLEGVKGLSEYLAAGLDLPALLLKSGVEKLTILPSGAPPQNPSELITSARMAALIQELKARYPDRYIILDSPPPMMAPETSAIANWVDGILLVVKYGATPMDLVEELMTQLEREKVIGAVINKFNTREFRRYSYNKYYRYSYKKYSQDGARPPA